MPTEEVGMAYTQAAVEQAVKVHEVLMQALSGRQPWIHVAEVLGVSAHTVRRLRWRYEQYGFTGLYDHHALAAGGAGGGSAAAAGALPRPLRAFADLANDGGVIGPVSAQIRTALQTIGEL